MAWELLAIWLIVVATIIWFIRDEKRLRAEAELERAARYYAHAPQYRHVTPEPTDPIVPPRLRQGGLTKEEREILLGLTAPRARAAD